MIQQSAKFLFHRHPRNDDRDKQKHSEQHHRAHPYQRFAFFSILFVKLRQLLLSVLFGCPHHLFRYVFPDTHCDHLAVMSNAVVVYGYIITQSKVNVQ